MKKQNLIPGYDHILHGGDYNPDQWQNDKTVISEDFQLMKMAHCNAFSVGIFAHTESDSTYYANLVDDPHLFQEY